MQLDEAQDPPRIRATQGHSVALDAPILRPVISVEDVADAVHVTSTEAWQLIQQDGFLRRMSRTHIHFATTRALARANRWATVCIRLRLHEALADGIPMFLSSNGVLLIEGPLPVKYLEVISDF